MKRVLSVGQCGYDHGKLSAALKKLFDVEVVGVDDDREAARKLGETTFDLVLVNRVFDVGGSGMDFLRSMTKTSAVPVMLVSNLEDAQKEAVEAGALPGFGKAALGQATLETCLRPILGT